jgi:phospholipase/carboxylesterase
MSRSSESMLLPLGPQRQVACRSPLACVAKLKGTQVARIVVGLHGYGDNAQNFSELADEIPLEDTLWVFSQGPGETPMTAQGAQWYNLFGPARREIEESTEKVKVLLQNLSLATHVPLSKVALFGFSQGAFLSLYTALTLSERLGAVVALSGFLGQTHRMGIPSAAALSNPYFIGHGLHDNVVLAAEHFETLDFLEFHGARKVVSKTYPFAHTVNANELADVTGFLKEHL